MYVLVEAFEDRGGGRGARQLGALQEGDRALPTLFADIPEIVNVEVPGGWSRMAEVQAEQ